jgi:hypothetical protein
MARKADPAGQQSMMFEQYNYKFDNLDVCAVAVEPADWENCVNARIDGMSMAELEERGRSVIGSGYHPASADLIQRLSLAWQRRCFEFQPDQQPGDLGFGPGLDDNSPADGMSMMEDRSFTFDCYAPPRAAFGDPATIATDAAANPMTNPHDQPEGYNLPR